MQMTGVDLNPVAWFVVKNELACSDPAQVRALFDSIESQVKPQVQPFYTTTCPRGHKGRWIDVETNQAVDVDPIDLPPSERHRYRWEGPEVIYTFWAKHGPCLAKDCGHRTPIFKTPVVAEKQLSADYIPLNCPKCSTAFHAELGETRMAPGVERVVLDGDTPFTELSQPIALLLNKYDQGSVADTLERARTLKDAIPEDAGCRCPSCGTFSGKTLLDVLEHHANPTTRASVRKKKRLGIQSKPVQMYLLVHPDWLKGASGSDNGQELGGWAGATAEDTAKWYERRVENLRLVEVRAATLPNSVSVASGNVIDTAAGTTPRQAQFSCGRCGRPGKTLEAVKETGHTASVAAYVLQCHCPQCEAEGCNYGGRYFKATEHYDVVRLTSSEREWERRSREDLSEYWPRLEMHYSHMTHERNPLPDHGYTHWWMLFGSRQLLVHSQILKTIAHAPEGEWSLDVREQALGALQQYLRMMCMFSFWHQTYDKLAPALSNANFNPKNLVVETSVYGSLGYGRWSACCETVLESLNWAKAPWELVVADDSITAKSVKGTCNDPLVPGNEPLCGSSTDLSILVGPPFDLVITDPPFGNNLYYADMADFFYVWLRIPLRRWYQGMPEAAYFEPERTPHSMEAVDNPAEHPDDREDYEKEPFIKAKHLARISELAGDDSLAVNGPNPFYRAEPSSDFYSQTLAAVWAEAGRHLKDGGLMAFTFHHSEDSAWVDVLMALFNAGYVLVATYPVRSDETKGDGSNAAFGSKKIEYDIIHVCRKRIGTPEPVSWSRMRRWVKEESKRLKDLLEHTHGKTLPESDLRVILRGKSLEFFSRHYGQVFTGDGQVLAVRDALLGINQLLDDLIETGGTEGGLRPPDSAEPASRLQMRLFQRCSTMARDELGKILRGTGVSQADLEARGWVREIAKDVHAVPIPERFAYFTERGRNRKIIKTDLDQTHFLIGAALPDSGLKIDAELNNPNFRVKRSVDEILRWIAEVDADPVIRRSANTAARLVAQWRIRADRPELIQPTLFDMLEENA
jgi:hypothetical protein